MLDIQLHQTSPGQGVKGATVLLDGKQVARFDEPKPERSVVFSKMVEGVTPGQHVLEIRIDAHDPSPSEYAASVVAHFDGKALPSKDVSGTLATGQALRCTV